MGNLERWFVCIAAVAIATAGCQRPPVAYGPGPTPREPEDQPLDSSPLSFLPKPTSSGSESKTAPAKLPPPPVQGHAPGHVRLQDAPPPPPEADETVTTGYKTSDESGIEVEGVCKITEDSVGCWSPDGAANENLASKIRDALEKQESQEPRWGPAVSLRYGKRNRVVVFKITQKVIGPIHGYLSIDSVGREPTAGSGGFFLNIDDASPVSRDQPFQVHYETRLVAESSSETTTTARIRLTTQVPQESTIENRVGATVDFAGETHTIVSIAKVVGARARKGSAGDAKLPVWTIKLKSTHQSQRPASVSLSPLDSAGKPIAYANQKGDPVSAEEFQKDMMAQQLKVQEHTSVHPGMPFSSSTQLQVQPAMGPVTGSPDGLEFSVFVNPAKIGRFRLTGVTTRRIDIRDICLDPK